MNYKNLDNFTAWLRNNAKAFNGNLDVYLDELANDYSANGSAIYELPGRETVSGNPESYFYSVQDTYYLDGEELTPEDVDNGADYDDYVRTFIF